jgi:hypothetical protein
MAINDGPEGELSDGERNFRLLVEGASPTTPYMLATAMSLIGMPVPRHQRL